MYIKRAIFTNFGKHRNLDLTFVHGLVGVVGPNGSGKSTITDGIYSALTNDFRRFAGVKNDNICLDSDEKENSSVHLFIEHEGLSFELYRGLRAPVKSWLKIDGKYIENANKIEQELRDKLGLNLKLLDTYVFVPQWEMFSFLAQTAGERADTYQMLCGTEKAKVIFKAIDKYLETEPDLKTQIVDNSDELRQLMAEQEAIVVKAKANIAEWRTRMLSETAVDAANCVLRDRSIYESLVPQIANLDQTIQTVQPKLAEATKELDEWEELSNSAAEVLAKLEPSVHQAEAQRSLIDNYNEHVEALAKKNKILAVANATLEACKLRAILPHEREDEIDKLLEQHAELSASNSRDSKFITQFETTKRAECPTCYTPVENLKPELDKAVARHKVNVKKQEELYALICGIRQQRSAFNDYDKTLYDTRKAVDNAQYALKLEQERQVEKPTMTKDEIDMIQFDYRTVRADAAKTDKARQAAFNAVQTLTAQLDSNTKLRESLLQQQREHTISDKEVADAKRLLEKHTAATTAIEYEKAAGIAAQKQVNGFKQQLEELANRLDRLRKTTLFAEKLGYIRDIMHAQALPQFVAQRNLQDMEHDINQELDQFGSPFWVEVSDDLSFIAHPAGRAAHRAERLSGGQKSVLAICFRTAICSLFDTQLDMLSLDEPTAGMDDENKRYLSEALRRYAAQVRGSRQVFLITHAQELRSAFDQVVDLGEIHG